MTVPIRRALCCTCGAIRTCHRPRNHRRENYWLSGPVDQNWHRELGDLKCANCGQITTHAILHREDNNFRDHDERITRIALGGKDPIDDGTIDEIRRKYRQGRQPNPFLNHLWSTRDAEAAREAGKSTVVTFCGEIQTLPEKSRTLGGTELLQPESVRWEQEYDPDTGAWWVEMDCPDCLRVANERRTDERRESVKLVLSWLLANYHRRDRVPDAAVETLLTVVESLPRGGASE